MNKNTKLQKQIKKIFKDRCGFPYFVSYIADKIAKKATRNNIGSRRIVEITKREGIGLGRLLAGCLFLLLAGYFPLLHAASQPDLKLYDVNVPSLNAAEALNRLAEQTGATFLFPYDVAETRQASEVVGRYRVMDALNLLLEGSELSSGLSRKGTIRIFLSDGPQNNNEETSMKKNKLSIGVFAALASLFGGEASAVESNPNQSTQLEELVVTGTRASLANALSAKRESVGIQDSIGAEDIGKFPDLNISESLQRVPGVTLTRTPSGEGSRINVRGLGPQFSRVEINGVTGTSSNSAIGGAQLQQGGRAFNFELLASELFQNAVISKSQTASQTEGGLAGLVQLETPRPLNYDNIKFATSVLGNWGEASSQVDPRAAAFFSKNFDDRLGVALSVAYSENTFQTNAVEFGSFAPANEGANDAGTGVPGVITAGSLASLPVADQGALTPRTSRLFSFVEDRETLGTTFTVQFKPTDEWELSFDSVYAQQNGTRTDDRPDVPVEGFPQATLTDAVVSNGVLTSGTVSGIQNRIGTSVRPFDDTLTQFALKADWEPSESWRITQHLGYTNREVERSQDLLSFAINGATSSFSVNGDIPNFSSEATDFISNPEDFGFNALLFFIRNNEDEETSYKLDFEHFFDDSPLTSFQFGFRYSQRDFERVFKQSILTGGSSIFGGNTPPGLDSVDISREFNVDGAGQYPDRILAVDGSLIESVFFPGLDPFTSDGFSRGDATDALGSFGVEEDIFAVYAQGNFEIDNLRFNAGLRVVQTDQISTGVSVTDQGAATEVIEQINIGNKYTEFLPSVNVSYSVNDDLVVRSTYSRSLSRAPLAQLAPNTQILSGTQTGTRGNPGLQPFTANQVDFGVEWYFADEAVLSGAYFIKELDSLVESSSITEQATFIDQITGLPRIGDVVFTTPINGESARIQGFEFQVQTPLPIVDGLGTLVNLTLADSESNFITADGTAFTTALEGLSEKSVNATLYYDKGNVDVRLSYAWRDQFLANRNDDFGVPRFTDDFGQLDLSSSYEINDNLSLQLQVTNLLDEQLTDLGSSALVPYGVTELERRIIFGLRYNL